MATYRELHGKAVKTVTTNPTDDAAEGQIWFNSTDNTFKSVVAAEAWISSGVLPTTRQNAEGAGTQTAGLASSGATGPGTPTFLNTSCEYNGTGWSGTTTKNAPGVIAEAVFGTQTAAVAAGGYNSSGTRTNTVEEYNGSSWTAVNTLPQAQTSGMGCGAENDGLVAGGEFTTVLTNTQEYDGTNWTAGGAIPAATYNAGAGGTSQSNSWFAGGGDSFKNATLIYDGSSWTASGNINTARDQHGGAGISTAALIFGGRTPPSTTSSATEKFDGTSWTTSPATLGTAAKQSAAFGTKSAAVYAGNDPAANITQEYNSSATVVTAGAFSSGPNISGTARRGLNCGGIGSITAGLMFCGTDASTAKNETEEYNGSSWTGGGNYPTGVQNIGGTGTQTAAIGFGGSNGSSNISTAADYNGSSWTAITSMPTTTWQPVGTGTAAAALSSGGAYPGSTSTTQTLEWDNSSWTAGGALTTARRYFSGFGSQTDSVAPGGFGSPNAMISATEEYNGSSWSTVNSMVTTIRSQTCGAESASSAGINATGTLDASSSTNQSFIYNGTTWQTNPSMSTDRVESAGIGDSTTLMVATGIAPWPSPGALVSTTEQFTAETTALNVKTLTQS